MAEAKYLRGSELVLQAWKNRQAHLTEDFVKELSEILAQSPGKVQSVEFEGGAAPHAATLSIAYDGEDIPICGNDLRLLHKLTGKHGISGPVVIINGVPALDRMNLEVQLGAP